MACLKPQRAVYNEDGRPRFVGALNDWDLNRSDEAQLVLKCGQCIGCRLERSRDWAIRSVHEAQMHKRNSFVTLTYDDDHLPDDRSVNVREWQLFAKKLRNKIGPFRFLHCGEYGSRANTLRPHYHAVIFGQDFGADAVPFEETDNGDMLYQSQTLTSLWGKGLAVLGELNFETAAYVARYVTKKVTGDKSEREYERVSPTTGEVWQVKPPYVTMSRNHGLGVKWLMKYWKDIYVDDVVHIEGRKFRPPYYYDKLVAIKAPERFEAIKERRRNRAKDQIFDVTEARRKTRERVMNKELQFFSPRLKV